MAEQELWSDDELREAVRVFRDAHALEQAGIDFKATDFAKRLAEALPSRKLSSTSRRLSNVAVALRDSGRPFSAKFGLSQTRAGTGVRGRIVRLWDELHDDGTFNAEELEERASELENGPLERPQGNEAPAQKSAAVVVYKRDPRVVAWVKRAAAGVCECCGAAAPFKTMRNRPFLEVHHLLQLAAGGPDVVENAVAICPNCHRALHHAIDRDARKADLIDKVARLRLF